jgi:ribosomal protein L11 methyltransferase
LLEEPSLRGRQPTETTAPIGTSQTRWLRLEVWVDLEQTDRLIEVLWELGTIGLEENDAGASRVLCAFFGEADESAVRESFGGRLHELGLSALRWELRRFAFDPDEWVEDYRRNFHGFPLSGTFYIHPSWEPSSSDYPVDLVIDPSHAFGTGTHESTQLCLESIAALSAEMRSLLDVGTGSGILAVAARKLCPTAKVCAMDNDPQAVEAAQESIWRNQVEKISLFAGELDAVRGSFQVVVANLTQGILDAAAAHLTRVTEERLVVSGFTEDQAHLVAERFQQFRGFRLAHSRTSGGWCCMEFARDSREPTAVT